jgi:protein transport protein SEC23
MDIYGQESRDGIRFSWNNFPTSKLASTRVVVPVGCLYSPARELDNLAVVEYEPQRCDNALRF